VISHVIDMKKQKTKPNYWKYATIVIVVLIGIYLISSLDIKKSPVKGNDPIDDDAILGNKNAPVTLVEFSDYQCSFCVRFWQQTFPEIKKNYIDTGKVRFVYRDFPLAFHEGAQIAAEAAECAREQKGDEAYFRMHDGIFSNSAYDETSLINLATTLGYDIKECLSLGTFTEEVQKDLSDGQALGIQGTPGFILNGKLISGAQPYSVFKEAIEAEL